MTTLASLYCSIYLCPIVYLLATRWYCSSLTFSFVISHYLQKSRTAKSPRSHSHIKEKRSLWSYYTASSVFLRAESLHLDFVSQGQEQIISSCLRAGGDISWVTNHTRSRENFGRIKSSLCSFVIILSGWPSLPQTIVAKVAELRSIETMISNSSCHDCHNFFPWSPFPPCSTAVPLDSRVLNNDESGGQSSGCGGLKGLHY